MSIPFTAHFQRKIVKHRTISVGKHQLTSSGSEVDGFYAVRFAICQSKQSN